MSLEEQITHDPSAREFFVKLADLLDEYGAQIYADQDGAGYVDVCGERLWVDALDSDKARKLAEGEPWCVPLRGGQ